MIYSDRKQAIQRLHSFPDELEARVRMLHDAELDKHEPGEWSTRQIVHHLADSHMSANFRFKKPLSENNPALMTYDQDAFVTLGDYALPVDSSLQIIRGLHERWVAMLESLTPEQWGMTGTHPDWGDVTVEYVLLHYAEHCDNHLDQIESALANG